jgi:hypothetical protein
LLSKDAPWNIPDRVVGQVRRKFVCRQLLHLSAFIILFVLFPRARIRTLQLLAPWNNKCPINPSLLPDGHLFARQIEYGSSRPNWIFLLKESPRHLSCFTERLHHRSSRWTCCSLNSAVWEWSFSFSFFYLSFFPC